MLPGKKYTPFDFLNMARRRVWLIVIPPIVTTFVALVYASGMPSVYQSDMLIAIVPQRVPDAFVRSTVTLRTEERLGAITAQVTSRTFLEQLINELDLYPVERRQLPMEDVVQRMRSSIATPLEASRGAQAPTAFHVKFVYPDPNVAARVTQRLGQLFVDQNARDRGALADATNQFLEKQLAEARARLEEQEQRLEAFRQRHGNELPTQMQSNLQAMQTTQLQIQAVVESLARDRDRKMMLERLQREAANEPVVQPPPPPAPPGPDAAPAVTTATQQLQVARANLARFEQRLTPEHPDILRLKRQIAELEPLAAAEAERSGAAAVPVVPPSAEEMRRREQLREMAAEIESLDRQTRFKESEEQRLRALVTEYQRRIEAVPAIESDWAALTRDYDTHQDAYKELLQKSDAAKLSVDLERRQIGEQFRILDPAGVPVHPIGSGKMQVNAVGFLAGLLIGVGLAALMEFRNAVYRSEADVVDVLDLPVLALVPFLETVVHRRRVRLKRILATCGAALALAGAGYVTWTLKLWTSVL
jgi:polysaccharide chain length determinant protein (PEP-CTERM system associated)